MRSEAREAILNVMALDDSITEDENAYIKEALEVRSMDIGLSMSAADARRMLGNISQATLRNLCRKHNIIPHRLSSKLVFYNVQDLHKLKQGKSRK